MTAVYGQCSPGWLPGSGVPGIQGTGYTTTNWDSDGPGPLGEVLVVAGSFGGVCDLAVNNIAVWDGSSWSSLGAGLSDSVNCVTVFNGQLIAAGRFTSSAGITLNRIARWDGTAWQPLGSGFNGEVECVVVHAGELVAAGAFTSSGATTINRIARWNGAAWQSLGTGASSRVNALVSVGSLLYAAGIFTDIGGQPANRIARWNGTTWAAVGAGLNNEVVCLGTWNGQVLAGGRFTESGGTPCNRIAAWNGALWEQLGNGSTQRVNTIRTLNADLMIGTDFSIRVWSGTDWLSFGEFTGAVNDIALYQGDLVPIGGFGQIPIQGPQNISKGICRWDGQGWHIWCDGGTNNTVHQLATFRDQLFASGLFLQIDGTYSPLLAVWNGSEWTRCDSPLPFGPVASCLTTVADSLIVSAGVNSGGVPLSFLYRWDGQEWQTFGTGIADGVGRCALEFEGHLVVAGSFQQAGGQSVGCIARWDGTEWHPFGAGFSDGGQTWVSGLSTFNDDLIAVGRFRTADGVPASCVARWDGQTWEQLGGGLNIEPFSEVNCVTTFDGELVVGGLGLRSGTQVLGQIARWNGSSWSEMGTIPGVVNAFTRDANSLLAAGRDGIYRWNGSGWDLLGGGTDGEVLTIATHRSEIVFGGYFGQVGGQVSAYFGRWSDSGSPWIASSPIDTRVRTGASAALDVTVARGYEGIAFQWSRNGTPITDGAGGASPGGGTVSGATTSSLFIDDVLVSDQGEYVCRVLNDCGHGDSEPAVLLVLCASDFDLDGLHTVADIFAFLAAWFGQQPDADIDGDGSVSVPDIFAFLAAWFAGCS